MDQNQLELLRFNTSPTFCMAKFHEATIWLYSGQIASCHHTPLSHTGDDLITFYNNDYKRQAQDSMLKGLKPEDCNYCWNLEKQGLQSDREFKSLHFKDHLSFEKYLDRNYNFKPKSLELSFQKTCNLACSYCSPSFSTEWVNDFKKHGNYIEITSDLKNTYVRGLDEEIPVRMDLFWHWFDTIKENLESLRITGGEPLLHEETFEIFDKMAKVNPNIEFVINTNLCQKPLIIERFIKSINRFQKFRINVSNESGGHVAEFIRDGMIYKEWLHALEKVVRYTKADVNVSTTLSALSLIGLDKMLLDIFELRKRNHIIQKFYVSFNVLTYPSFQSFNMLSKEQRQFYHNKYNIFYLNFKEDFVELEKITFPRILNSLSLEKLDSNYLLLQKDAESFFKQYTIRRNKQENLYFRLGLE